MFLKTIFKYLLFWKNKFLLQDTTDGFSAKKLENFAYQACDKIYNKEDNGPYDNLRLIFIKNYINSFVFVTGSLHYCYIGYVHF